MSRAEGGGTGGGWISRSARPARPRSAARSSSAGPSPAINCRRRSRSVSASASRALLLLGVLALTRSPAAPAAGRAGVGVRARLRRVRGRVDVLLLGPRARHGRRGRARSSTRTRPSIAVTEVVHRRHALAVADAGRARAGACRAARSSRSAAGGSRSPRPGVAFVGGVDRDVLDLRARQRPRARAHRLDHRGHLDGASARRSGRATFGARCAGNSRCRRATRSSVLVRQRCRDRDRVHVVLRRARPHRRDPHRDRAWRSRPSRASCSAPIFLGESVRPDRRVRRRRGAHGRGDRRAERIDAGFGRGARVGVAAVAGAR